VVGPVSGCVFKIAFGPGSAQADWRVVKDLDTPLIMVLSKEFSFSAGLQPQSTRQGIGLQREWAYFSAFVGYALTRPSGSIG
jgi:hypothetical protein